MKAPAPQRPHWTSHFIVPTADEILVRLYTDEGIDGFGLATSYTPIDFAVKAPCTHRRLQSCGLHR